MGDILFSLINLAAQPKARHQKYKALYYGTIIILSVLLAVSAILSILK